MHNFYQKHAQRYFTQTSAVDPSSFLQPLAQRIPTTGKILDIACGSGRDLRWFKQKGMSATGLEAAGDLAHLASVYSACPVIVADFTRAPLKPACFDALLMIGAFVHLEHARLQSVLAGLLPSLRPGGLALLSLKEGTGLRQHDDGRVFYLWSARDLEQIFFRLGLRVIEQKRQVSKIRDSDIWLSFLLRQAS